MVDLCLFLFILFSALFLVFYKKEKIEYCNWLKNVPAGDEMVAFEDRGKILIVGNLIISVHVCVCLCVLLGWVYRSVL